MKNKKFQTEEHSNVQVFCVSDNIIIIYDHIKYTIVYL